MGKTGSPKTHVISIFSRRMEEDRDYDQNTVHLSRHYEVSEPGEAHKLGIKETNVQEKNTCLTTEHKI